MTDSLFSPSWYRVNTLKPRVRSHMELHRHTYRGQIWYLLQDHASGRFQRFTPTAHFIIGLMNGERTVEEIWQAGRERLGEDAPSQDEMIRLLGELHAADALLSDVPPDTLELLNRYEKKRGLKWKQNIRNPLAMRFSVFDPEKFLTRFQAVARPFFGWVGACLWLAVVGIGAILAGLHWPELTENITDVVLTPKNIVVMWCIFPFLKALHEFGHAFAIKVRGGEVHEMGIMFLVLTPIPYVDASSSIGFRSKWARALVGAAGIAVELFVGALALMLWVNAEPGAVRSLLYNIILIGGVSSIFFNGNPLLRYDGYYILSDLTEIPNLAQRGTKYLAYLAQYYLFGNHDVEPPLATQGEKVWFVTYTILSFFYRIIIYVSIIQFIAGKFLTLGLLLAVWSIVAMFGLPLYRGAKFLFSSPGLSHKRGRAIAVSAAIIVFLLIAITLIPLPLRSVAEGVLWFPDESVVRAKTDGFVEELAAKSGTSVVAGSPLVNCSDPLLSARIRVLEAQLRELEVQYDINERTNRVKAQVALDDIEQVKQQLDDARKRADDLTVISRSQGTLFVPTPQDLPGRFVKRGEVIGYVLNKSSISARVVVPQADVDLVRVRTIRATMRLPERINEVVPVRLIREVPGGTDQLPARVLSQEGGGQVAIDPRDEKGTTAFQRVFLFDVQLPAQSYLFNVEGRVYVRFDHGWEPVICRWYRAVRQLLLRRFNV